MLWESSPESDESSEESAMSGCTEWLCLGRLSALEDFFPEVPGVATDAVMFGAALSNASCTSWVMRSCRALSCGSDVLITLALSPSLSGSGATTCFWYLLLVPFPFRELERGILKTANN